MKTVYIPKGETVHYESLTTIFCTLYNERQDYNLYAIKKYPRC